MASSILFTFFSRKRSHSGFDQFLTFCSLCALAAVRQMEYLNEYIRTHHKFSFRNLLMHQKSKLHIVVTFLAVLEMMKIGAITIEQEHTFGEIMITSRQDSQSGERWNTENED